MGVHLRTGMPFGFLPESRSASPEYAMFLVAVEPAVRWQHSVRKKSKPTPSSSVYEPRIERLIFVPTPHRRMAVEPRL